jgi:hypothetical protein
MSKTILDELDDFQQTLDEFRHIYESDGNITPDEQDHLDSLAKKISRLRESVNGTVDREVAGDNGNGSPAIFKGQHVNRADTPPPAPSGQGQSPVPAPKREIKLEVGSGSLKGSIVGTFEHGKSAVQIDESAWKAFQQKTTVKLNGIAAKAEAKLIRGETDFEIIDGLSFAIEVAGGKMDVSADKGLEVSLMTITLKVIGDLSKWMKDPDFARTLGPGWDKIGPRDDIKFTIEGRLQISLGSIPELKKKIAALAASQADEVKHAKRIGELADDLDKARKESSKLADEITKLEWEERELGRQGKPTDATRKAMDAKRAERRAVDSNLYKARDELKKATSELSKAKNVSDSLRKKVTGKLGSAVTKLMATKTAQLVGRILLKAIPIVNVISTIIDVLGLIKDLYNLFSRYKGDGAEGEAEGSGEKGKGSGGKDANGPTDGPVTSPAQVDKKLPPASPKPANKPNGPTSKGSKGGTGPITRPDQVPDPKRLDDDPRVVLMRDFPDKVVKEWFEFQRDQLVVSQKAKDWIKQHVGKESDGLSIKAAHPQVSKQQADGYAAKAQVGFEYSIDQDRHAHEHYLFIHNKGGGYYVARMTGPVSGGPVD